MATIQIYDPALCCSSGVCGEDVDRALVNFSADADWAKQQDAPLNCWQVCCSISWVLSGM